MAAQPVTVSAQPRRAEVRRMPAQATRALWRHWVAANALGEFVGLGLTGALAGLAVVLLEPRSRAAATVAIIASGAVEGVVVGYAQWRVLRGRLPVSAAAWVTATVVGALAAWTAGVIPALLAEGAGATSEPPVAAQLGLAAVLGLAAGSVLGGPQAVVLRHHVPRAWRWVLANALAWACALPLTFLAPSLVPAAAPPATLGVGFALGALIAGTVAGAVHGGVLVSLLGGRGVELLNPLLHRLLGGRGGPLLGALALLQFTGRRTGRHVAVGASSAALTAGYVVIAADAPRKHWWRNFLPPRPLTIRTKGRTRSAVGRLASSGAELEAALAAYRAQYPRSAITADDVRAGHAAVVLIDVVNPGADLCAADRGDWLQSAGNPRSSSGTSEGRPHGDKASGAAD